MSLSSVLLIVGVGDGSAGGWTLLTCDGGESIRDEDSVVPVVVVPVVVVPVVVALVVVALVAVAPVAVAPVIVAPVVVGPVVVVPVPPNIRAPIRFGSVHSNVPLGVICGNACARI